MKNGEVIKDAQLGKLSKIENFFYGNFWFRVPVFVLGAIIVRILISKIFGQKYGVLFYSSIFLMTFIAIYLTVFLFFLVKHSIKSLLYAKNFWVLSIAYIVLILTLLVLFSSAYNSVEKMQKGYLTFGTCQDKFLPSMIESDEQRSSSYFYFSAITLFTVGYGDICPMGWSKSISMFNAFVGIFINTIVMIIVLSSYLSRRKEIN